MPRFALEIVECPECAAPAEVVDRFVLESTDGPVEHVIVLCVLRHRFTMLVERLRTRGIGTPQDTPSSGRAGPARPRGHRQR